MKSFLDAGVNMVFGSDAPVAKLDPWHTIAMATDRSSDGRPAWHPEEALSFEQALRCSQRGAVAVGEPADLIVLGANNDVLHVVSG
jgi:predicted amidohydrolase YtcJ